LVPVGCNRYREHGEYTDSTLRTRFGSWSDALQAAGLDDTGSKRPVPTAELIDDLQALAVKLGEPPTATQMDERGPRWRSVYHRFGSRNDALAAAGSGTREPASEVPEAELLAELHHLAAVGRPRAPPAGVPPHRRCSSTPLRHYPSTPLHHPHAWGTAAAADLLINTPE